MATAVLLRCACADSSALAYRRHHEGVCPCPERLRPRAGEFGGVAVLAAMAVQSAQLLAEIQRLAAQLQSKLQSRGLVDRAVGVMMSRTRGTEGEALARLRALSQNEDQQLEIVAGRIVEEAVGRAEGSGPH